MDSQSIFELPPNLTATTPTSQAILRTLIYSDLFAYPLKACEIHTGLVSHKASLDDVRRVLNNSGLDKYIDTSDGFYYLKGKQKSICNRKTNEVESERILKKHRRVLRFISIFPFVRSANLSGAIAFKNCTHDDDIDLFLIVDSKRTWSVYFFLLLFLKLTGKRRTFCLNYIYGKDSLEVSVKDFFVAHQIAHLRPLSGRAVYEKFVAANAWLRDYLPQAKLSNGSFFPEDVWNGYFDRKREPRVKSAAESVFGSRPFDWVESLVSRIFGAALSRKLMKFEGTVLLHRDELKLFTHDHRQKVMSEFQARLTNLNPQSD